jgi:predicted alpha/beta-hydrolase family hydrolase
MVRTIGGQRRLRAPSAAAKLAVNPVHHPGKPDGVRTRAWPFVLAVNPVHHPGKPDGVYGL